LYNRGGNASAGRRTAEERTRVFATFALVMLLVAIIRWRYRREIAALPRANPQV
jgi:hypothetical protein